MSSNNDAETHELCIKQVGFQPATKHKIEMMRHSINTTTNSKIMT